MQRNRIVSTKLKPRVITLSAIALAMLACMAFVNKKPEILEQKHKIEKNPVRVMNIVFTSFIVYFMIACLIPLYRNANRFAAEIAQEYVKKIMSEHPEFQRFQPLLQNQSIMKKLATMIANELRNDEQQRILDLIDEIHLDSTTEQIEDIHNKIVKIIEEHTIVHPEFMERVYSAMANADYVEYVKQIQRANKEKIK